MRGAKFWWGWSLDRLVLSFRELWRISWWCRGRWVWNYRHRGGCLQAIGRARHWCRRKMVSDLWQRLLISYWIHLNVHFVRSVIIQLKSIFLLSRKYCTRKFQKKILQSYLRTSLPRYLKEINSFMSLWGILPYTPLVNKSWWIICRSVSKLSLTCKTPPLGLWYKSVKLNTTQ